MNKKGTEYRDPEIPQCNCWFQSTLHPSMLFGNLFFDQLVPWTLTQIGCSSAIPGSKCATDGGEFHEDNV